MSRKAKFRALDKGIIMQYTLRALAVALSLAVLSITAMSASGHKLSPQLAREYQRTYHRVAHQFGKRTPGRNIVRWGRVRDNKTPSKEQVAASLRTLHRMLAPPPPPPAPVVAPVVSSTPALAGQTSTPPAPAQSASAPASSGLEACIISHESGGNPQATNGQYGGIGQWSPAAWAQDGGTKYSSSPTGASYAQQQQVLSSEGSAGMQQQQGQYDGC